jgi:hypothetical protein
MAWWEWSNEGSVYCPALLRLKFSTCRELIVQEVDWALGKFTITSIRDEVIDYTNPFWYEPAVIVQKRPSPNAMYTYVGPFRQEVWWSVIASVPFMGVVLAFVRYAEERLVREGKTRGFTETARVSLWYSYGAMLQQGRLII